ncbi:dethiobiotin synthase, partial [Staphylococcus aureus]
FDDSMISHDNQETLDRYLNRSIYTFTEGANVSEVPDELLHSLIRGGINE